MILDGANSKITLTTTTTADIEAQTSWVLYNSAASPPTSLGTDNTTFNTATTQDIVPPPGASKQAMVEVIAIRNAHASNTNDISIKHLDATPTTVTVFKCTLAPGESCVYTPKSGFQVFDATGALKTNTSSVLPLLTTIEQETTQRIFESGLSKSIQTAGSFLLISGTAYCVYVGRATKTFTAAFIEYHVQAVGAGAQTAEVGLFSSPNPPNKSNQTLTKIAATGTLNALTATGVGRNTSSLAQAIAAGTHLWAVLRTAMATTQPTLVGLVGDKAEGRIQTLAGASALTGVSSLAATIPSASALTNCPDLAVTLD